MSITLTHVLSGITVLLTVMVVPWAVFVTSRLLTVQMHLNKLLEWKDNTALLKRDDAELIRLQVAEELRTRMVSFEARISVLESKDKR